MVRKNTDYDYDYDSVNGGRLTNILKKIKKVKREARKSIANSEQEFDGDGLFKKIRRGVSKASKTLHKGVKIVDDAKTTAKKAVVKKANQFDSDIKSKNTQRVVGRYARRQGKEGLKYVAREGIAATVDAGLSTVGVPPGLGSIAADQIMSRSGADKKIDGLGFGKNVRKITNRRRKTVSGGEVFFDDDENAEKNISGTSFKSSGDSLNRNPRPSDKASVKDVYNEYYGKSFRGSSFRPSGGTLAEIRLQGQSDHEGHFIPGRTRSPHDEKRAPLYLDGKFAKDKHKIIVLSGGSFLQ
jgi:hypothetical protein